jgi:hypothetical protein
MDYLLNILAGLIGVIAGAALSWLIGTRQSQVAATCKLHRVYHGAAMNDSRERAGRIVHKHPEATYVNLWYMLDPADAQHIWNVMYFYQRLWLAIEYRNVHRKLVPDLFGESFYWWYSNSFAGQLLPVNDEAARDIGSLRDWLIAHSSEEQRMNWIAYRSTWKRMESGL